MLRRFAPVFFTVARTYGRARIDIPPTLAYYTGKLGF